MKGSIILNGNIEFEVDYIYKFKEKLLSSIHKDPKVREDKKVLLITAAWRRDEHREEHVKEAIRDIGIKSLYKDGYDVNIQNLSIYHMFNEFKKKEPRLYKFYHEKQENIIAVKEFYRKKNHSLVGLLKSQVRQIRKEFPGTSFAEIMAYDVKEETRTLVDKNVKQHRFHYYCRDIQYTLKHIRDMDNEMALVSREIDNYFFTKSKVMENPTYKTQKEILEKRILSANSIFIFGGNVAVLMNRLNFYKLKDTFRKALADGTNFFTVSAGSDVLSDKIILYGWVDLEHPEVHRDFEFFDHGFGLITKLTLFPHCLDRIKTRDPDTLSYLAHRFESSIAVGLDQLSFLKLETYADENEQIYERYVSVGKEEGVYVFDKSGKLIVKEFGDELEIPGSKIYESHHPELFNKSLEWSST
ncbi:MAG: Type 1 glutamine amidotransferase-like domain-containing protein [Vulcanimicrobiota bacterium]